LPDLKVSIEQTSLFGSSYTTPTIQDTTHAVFDAKSIRVTEGDTIRITVYDEDVLADDTIATQEIGITADTINRRYVDWTFGEVFSLQLEFRP
jgi:hypothetical protein